MLVSPWKRNRSSVPGVRVPRPELIISPRSDEAFVTQARDLVERRGVLRPQELQEALRKSYPHVQVRERGLSAEGVIWYVYREGTWIPSES
jgi:hypothetical protein